MSAALQGPSERILLETPVLTIGRAPDNQLVLSDVKASTHHALIQMHEPNPLLFDLDSTNGTFVNNFRLVSRVPYPLRPGDNVRIGDMVYIFEQDDPEATKRATPPPVKQPDQATYDPTVRPGAPGPVVPPLQTSWMETSPYAPQPPLGTSFPPVAPPSPERSLWSSATSPDAQQNSFPQSPPWGYAPGSGGPLLQSSSWGSVPVDPAAPTSPYIQGSIAPPLYGPPWNTQQPQSGKKRRNSKVLLIIGVVVVLLGLIGGGYELLIPRPTIKVSSAYNAGNVIVGSTGTSLSISGYKFSSVSAVTFLLDGKPIPGGGHIVQSNGGGDVSTTLQLTDNWPLGRHMLTAKDASGYTTSQGVAIQVVKRGEANTPGPNGAPPDDASLNINTSVTLNGDPMQHTETLTITGRPDPKGGTVCIEGDDNGQPHPVTGSTGNVTFRETIVLSCSGLYKNGQLTYTETATSDKIEFSNGLTCTAHTPYTYQHLTGAFTNATSIKGTFTSDNVTVDCSNGVGTQQLNGNQGTWTGQTVQGSTTNQTV